MPDIYEGFILRLQSLGGPNEPQLRALVGVGHEIVDGYETVEQGVTAGDRNRIARGSCDVGPEKKSKFAFAARGYGLTQCSHGRGFTGGVGFPFGSLG